MLTSQQQYDLEVIAKDYLAERYRDVTDIVVPVHAIDWGFQYHPDLCEEVTEVECYFRNGCVTLFVSSDYEVVEEDFSPYFETV